MQSALRVLRTEKIRLFFVSVLVVLVVLVVHGFIGNVQVFRLLTLNIQVQHPSRTSVFGASKLFILWNFMPSCSVKTLQEEVSQLYM